MPNRLAQRNARLDALVAAHAPRIRAALVRQVEPTLARLAQLDAVTPAVALLLAAMVTPDRLWQPLEALYVAGGTAEAADTYRWLTAGMKAQAPPAVKEGWAGRLRRFITTEGAAAVRGITDTTRRLVARVLTEAADAGHSVEVAATALREQVATLSRSRAMSIANTELNAASNYGSLIGAEATGLALDRLWLSTHDGRTRETHAAADGQRAALQGGTFTVGGYTARYPGDPLLPVSERARCRCAIGYAPKQ